MVKKISVKKRKSTNTATWDIAKRPAVCRICDAKIKKGDGIFIVKKNTIGYPPGIYCTEEKEGEETCADRVYGDYIFGTQITYHKV